jgi:hypothetical protein
MWQKVTLTILSVFVTGLMAWGSGEWQKFPGWLRLFLCALAAIYLASRIHLCVMSMPYSMLDDADRVDTDILISVAWYSSFVDVLGGLTWLSFLHDRP